MYKVLICLNIFCTFLCGREYIEKGRLIYLFVGLMNAAYATGIILNRV